ncbi:hypothetical protein D9C01_13735, partial [Corynebacterium diphtheriae]
EEEAAGTTGETIPAGTAALIEQGSSSQTAEELRRRVEDALAEEIGLLLAEEEAAGTTGETIPAGTAALIEQGSSSQTAEELR